MKPVIRAVAITLPLLASALALDACSDMPTMHDTHTQADPALAAAIHSTARTPEFVARDAVRHPAEELKFFGLRQDMHVMEVWPGGGYWTEILLPYLKEHGKYVAAVSPPPPPKAGEPPRVDKWKLRFDGDGALSAANGIHLLGRGQYDAGPPASLDMILTFRNLHNWMYAGDADKVLGAFYGALKPGGILGIEDHRARADKEQDPKAASGYVREDYAIALARKAGFEYVGKSEINANPKDTANWPDGVWTLPPVLSQGDKDREKYLAIGEADNFVLKFRKPG